jgi:hypothetical protein
MSVHADPPYIRDQLAQPVGQRQEHRVEVVGIRPFQHLMEAVDRPAKSIVILTPERLPQLAVVRLTVT